MNTTRFLTAAAVVLGAGVALNVVGAPVHAAPGTPPAQVAACQSLAGSFELDGEGGWWCTHPVGVEVRDPALLAVCVTDSWAYLVDDGAPEGTVAFYCSPALIN